MLNEIRSSEGTTLLITDEQNIPEDSSDDDSHWNGRTVRVCCGLSPTTAKIVHILSTLLVGSLASLALALTNSEIGLSVEVITGVVGAITLASMLSIGVALGAYNKKLECCCSETSFLEEAQVT